MSNTKSNAAALTVLGALASNKQVTIRTVNWVRGSAAVAFARKANAATKTAASTKTFSVRFQDVVKNAKVLARKSKGTLSNEASIMAALNNLFSPPAAPAKVAAKRTFNVQGRRTAATRTHGVKTQATADLGARRVSTRRSTVRTTANGLTLPN